MVFIIKLHFKLLFLNEFYKKIKLFPFLLLSFWGPPSPGGYTHLGVSPSWGAPLFRGIVSVWGVPPDCRGTPNFEGVLLVWVGHFPSQVADFKGKVFKD